MSADVRDTGSLEFLQPAGWAAPRGYANGVAATGRIVFVGGQIGWNRSQQLESDDFVAQARRAHQHCGGARRSWCAAGACRPDDVVCHRREYLACGKALGAAYREIMDATTPR
jgi:enamine deaminase RidA (YjgF/YER057c/UK114 family)